MTLRCHIEAIGLAAPGMADWASARDILAGREPWKRSDDVAWPPSLLPPNERRRVTPSVRLAFRAAEDAMRASALPFAELPSVFASADADLGVLDRLCTALASPPGLLSPTDFHNSVHNAASGYWSIAIRSMAPTTTIAALDGSFAAGLIEAAVSLSESPRGVLLVAYDVPAPAPLAAKRPLGAAGSVALVLTAAPSDATLATLAIEPATNAETACLDAALEPLRLTNAALRALPMLECIARGVGREIIVSGAGAARWRIGVSA